MSDFHQNYAAKIEFPSEEDRKHFIAEVGLKTAYSDIIEKTVKDDENPEVIIVVPDKVFNQFTFWQLIDEALWEVKPDFVDIVFYSQYHYDF